MPIYDQVRFSPPAPCADVMLKDISTGKTIQQVSLLIDSGADITVLPKKAVEAIGVTTDSVSSYEVQGFDGRTSIAYAVKLDLVFLSRTFRGRFLLADDELGILGRDVINLVSILLDGPRQVWSESAAAAS